MNRPPKLISDLPDELSPLKAYAEKYLKYPSEVNGDGILKIGHRPWIANLNYIITLYPGLPKQIIKKHLLQYGFVKITNEYIEILNSLNGGFFFGMSLFGIPYSMLKDPPRLERSYLQCHDLVSANLNWINEYNISEDLFHFGSRIYSYDENIGYFIDNKGTIHSIRKNGAIVGDWKNFKKFLQDELKASEELEEELKPSKWGG